MTAVIGEVIGTIAKYSGLIAELVELVREAISKPLSEDEVRASLARITEREGKIVKSVWDTVKS